MLMGLLSSNLLKWIMGPAGRIALLALAFVGWTLYQRHDATRTCEAAELIEELQETQRQLELAEKIAEDARNRATKTEAEIGQLESVVNELKTDLEKQPQNQCAIDPDTRERLLRIK